MNPVALFVPTLTVGLDLALAAAGVAVAVTPPPEPVTQTWRPATATEDQTWQAHHLTDVLRAWRNHPNPDAGEADARLAGAAATAPCEAPTGVGAPDGAGVSDPG